MISDKIRIVKRAAVQGSPFFISIADRCFVTTYGWLS